MKLFYRIGFKDMKIISNEGLINTIRSRKSDNLSFRLAENE